MPAPPGIMAPMSEHPRLQGRDIVCVGFADWDTELWTNQHHLMSRLARDNRVLFVESLGLRRPQLAGRDLARIARRLRRGLRPPRAVDGLHVLSPLVLPLHRSRLARALNRRLLPALVGRAARRLGMRHPILWAYVPQAEVLINALDPSLIVYHCVDDIAAQDRIDTRELSRRRDALRRTRRPRAGQRSRAGRAAAEDLKQRSGRAERRRHRALLQSARAGAARPPDGRAGRSPGSCSPARSWPSSWISHCSPSWPACGRRGRLRWSARSARANLAPISRQSANEPNIHLLGPRTYAELPDVLRAADAGLIPYARNPLTDSIFPMKVYEYLAAGLPVVATPLPALVGLADIATAPDAQGIAELLDEALAEDDPTIAAPSARVHAASHSWEQRLEAIARRDRRRVTDLLVTTHTPVLGSGQAVRTYGVARALAAHGGLTLLYVRFGAAEPDAAFRAIPGVELVEVVPSRGLRRLLAYGSARLAGVPAGFARGVSRELGRRSREARGRARPRTA